MDFKVLGSAKVANDCRKTRCAAITEAATAQHDQSPEADRDLRSA